MKGFAILIVVAFRFVLLAPLLRQFEIVCDGTGFVSSDSGESV
jgi:hypothetical protein